MEDPRTGILRFGLRKVFMFLLLLYQGEHTLGNLGSYICRGASLSTGRHRTPTEVLKFKYAHMQQRLMSRMGGSHPDHHKDSNHEMAEPLTSFSCTTFRHSFIWPRWSFLYLINWFSVHFWLFSISSYTFVESELNLRKTILMSEFKKISIKMIQ